MAPDTNYHELRIKLLKSCRKLARNGDELEDAVQAGLVTYMETYDGDDSKHAFTYAYRCVVNALRRSRWKRDKEIMRSDEQWLTLEGVPESVRIDTLPHAPSTESIVCGKDDFLFALAEINQIPARPKLMLVLYGLGFEYKEVARLTGVKTGTVSSRINEARSLLGRSSTHEIKGDHKMLRRSFPDSEALLTWALDQCANKSPAHYARLTDNESGTSATDDAKETGKTMDDNT
jgi:RNA polymerase sigma factor (sigma-70 family)